VTFLSSANALMLYKTYFVRIRYTAVLTCEGRTMQTYYVEFRGLDFSYRAMYNIRLYSALGKSLCA
jgi:hypothetical protein